MANAHCNRSSTGFGSESQPLLENQELNRKRITCPARCPKPKMCSKVVLGLLICDFIFSLVFDVLDNELLMRSNVLKFEAAPLVIDFFILFS